MPNIIEFELLDILDKTKNLKYLRDYVRKICLNKDSINVKEYLLKKVNSKTVLELISKEWERLNAIYNTEILISILINDEYLLNECIKIKFLKIFKNQPTYIFERKIFNTLLIEYLFQNNYISKKNLDIFLTYENIFLYLKKYNKEYLLENINLNELLIKKRNDKLYLDEYIDANINIKITQINNDLLEEIVNRKAYNLLINLDEKQLLRKINGKTLLELLLENNINPNLNKYEKEESVILIAKYNKHELLQNTNPSLFMLKNHKYIIEEILEKKLNINQERISDLNIIYYIIKYNRTDLYENLDYKTLISNNSKNNKYLDIILEQTKLDNNIKLPKVKIGHISNISFKEYAKIYICYAKHDLENKLPINLKMFLTLDKLRKKTFLEYLLEEDEEITKSKFINKINTDEIQIILKLHEYKKQYPNIKKILEHLINEQHEMYKSNNDDIEIEILINELINTFSDEYKDEKILELLKINYTYLCLKDKKYLNEVKRLIELKRNIPHLSLSITDEGSFYKQDRISLLNADLFTLNHELGHLLFHFNAGELIPKEFDIIMFKLANDKIFFENKVKEFTKITQEVLKNTTEESKKIYEQFIVEKDITKEDLEELVGYLEDTSSYSLLLKSIKNNINTITIDEYKNKDKKIKQEMIKHQIIKNKYPGLLIISDIIDAIFAGKYFDNLLVDKKGEKLLAISGHGCVYYNKNRTNIFNEIIANYNALLKINESELYIELLRKIVGDDLVNLLDEYYNENILYCESNKIR